VTYDVSSKVYRGKNLLISAPSFLDKLTDFSEILHTLSFNLVNNRGMLCAEAFVDF